MKYIIGIGNPGKPYVKTRHNAGFQVLDCLDRFLGDRRQSPVKWARDKYLQSEISEHPDVVLIKPQTYVNLTGQTVAVLKDKHKVVCADLLFVCDDANLEFGQMRLRPSGGAGGHHGLESVTEALGTEDFARLRIGVGNDTMGRDLAEFVLADFSAHEQKEIPLILDKAVLACQAWVLRGYKAATDLLSRQGSQQKGE